MRNFKRVVVSALSVALCFAVLVGAAVFPYFTMESYYYQDNRVRKELAGTIDFFVHRRVPRPAGHGPPGAGRAAGLLQL